MNLNSISIRKVSNKKKKKSFLKTCVYTFTTLALVVASVVGLSSLKPSKKLNLEVVSGDSHNVSTINISGDTLTEDMLRDEVEEGKVFSGWYYDNNYTKKANVGDKIDGTTTLYSRQMSLTEGAFWSRVDNQLNAGVIGSSHTSPFSNQNGDGTEASPYIITTPEDMGVFSRIMSELEWEDFYLTSYYKLANDIKLDEVDVTWPSIGTQSRPFTGTFDGDGHMVYYIYGTKGLFNYVENATIKNLTIKGLRVSATETVGGLASFVSGSSIIQNCQMFGDVTSNSTQVGGLIGKIIGTSSVKAQVVTCSTNVIITSTSTSATSYASGVIGSAEYVDIVGCVSNGEVEASGSSIGGIVGYATRTLISHSINASVVTGMGNVGGIVGVLKDSGSVIRNSFNRGIIEANGSNIGGIVGMSEGTILNTFNLAKIRAINNSTYVAGIVGYADKNANVSYSYSLGNIFTGSSSISYNPISNGTGKVNDCGYNNAHEVNGVLAESSNQINSNYGNIKSLYDGTNATDQQILVDSLKLIESYTNYSTIGIYWNSESLWLTNFIDFSGFKPNILSGADFTQELSQITYYINGLKKMIRTYTTTEVVSAPTYKGQTVTYYTDSLYTNAYSFGKKIITDITLYGKCKTIDEGLQYNVSITPEITSVALNSTNNTAINGHDYKATLSVRNGKAIKSVTVVMENNSNPIYSFNQNTNEIIVNDVVGDIVINPVVQDVLYTVSASGLVNMTLSNTSSIAYGSTFSAILTPNSGYELPSSLVVSMNGKTLTSGYTYNKSTGQLTIPNVSGNISISGTATIKSYSIDTSGLTNITISSSQSSVNHGSSYNATLKANTGYTLPTSITIKINGAVISSGYTYTQSSGAITINSVTGNVSIVATATVAEVNISYENHGGSASVSGSLKYSGTDKTVSISYTNSDERYYNVKIGDTYVIKNSAVVSSAYSSNVKGVTSNQFTLTGTITLDITVEVYSTYTEPVDPCLVEGTWITLANGKKKKIEDITYDDEVLVWDFDKGCFTKAKPFWIKVPQKASAVMRCEFSDGSVIETVRGHAVYNIEESTFMNAHNDKFRPGFTHTFNEKGEKVLLVKKEVVYKDVNYYNFHTMYHMNNFSNGVLTSLAENNLYPIKDMKFVKEERELIPYEVFEKAGVPRRYYDGLRLAETPKDMVQNRIELVKELLEPVEVKFEQK